MGLWDKIDALKDSLARRFVDAPKRKTFLKERGIGVLPIFDEDAAFAPYKRAVDGVIASGRLEDFLAANDAAFASGQRLANGYPAHSLQRNYLWARLSEQPERKRKAVTQWTEAYRRKPDAGVAAMLAYSLDQVGWEHRGSGFGGPGDPEDDALWGAFFTEARDAMSRHAADGPANRTWRRMRFSISVGEGVSREGLQARYDAAIADDPHDIGLWAGYANAVLPRWYGEDAGEVERFARRVAQETMPVFGSGAYGLIYGFNTSIGSHEPEDTQVDRALIDVAFNDLMARFPAPSIVNLYLKTLIWLDDDASLDKALEIAATRLTAMVPDVWDGDTPQERMEDAEDALDLILTAG